jgi:hypothetical protein
LVHLLPQSFAFDLETWVVCHEDLRSLARVRAVFDALVVGLSGYVANGQPFCGEIDETRSKFGFHGLRPAGKKARLGEEAGPGEVLHGDGGGELRS